MLGIADWDVYCPPAISSAIFMRHEEVVKWGNDVAEMGFNIDPYDVELFILGVPLEQIHSLRSQRMERDALTMMLIRIL
jgi:hypothetical protein